MPSTEPISPIFGTGQDDTIYGTNRSDVISAKAGDDTAFGSNGNDEVWGGSGDDLLYGNNGNDVLFGSGGPNFIPTATFTLAEDYPVRVIFSGETAGYRNSFGYYKVDGETGAIGGVDIVWENASLAGSGGSLVQGVSDAHLDVGAGDTFGVFIVSNGYGYNNYNVLGEGSYEFRDADGDRATLDSDDPRLWHVADDGTETQISAPQGIYHTAGYGDDVQLNRDDQVHTKGYVKLDAGQVKIGFEDLYGLGDRDYDDSVFTLDVGTANATFINAHYNLGGGDEDPDTDDGDSPSAPLFTDNDVLYGGAGSDEIYGKGGNDRLYGESGTDELHGGSGADILDGGTGADVLYGNSGADTLYGGNSPDILYGGSDGDTLHGGDSGDTLHGNSGDDNLYGEAGTDLLYGGSGNDLLNGGKSADELHGNSGDDRLYGGDAADRLEGGSGDDYLNGGAAADVINGGSGNDYIVTGAGADVVNGGSGIDTVDYSGAARAMRIDLHGKRTAGGDSDSLISVENAVGSDFDDIFRGDLRDNDLDGGAGDDVLRGTKGADRLTGGEGADSFLWYDRDLDGSLDRLTDFDAATGDRLDISKIIGEDSDFDIAEYIDFTDDGTDTTVRVDLEGGGEDWINLAVLEGVSGVTVEDAEDADYFNFA